MNKKTFTNNKKKGFTLVELSIVLIIIGLLVTGVTAGASLIKNAELRSVMSEATGYRTAVNSFYSKYSGNFPGDYAQTIGSATGSQLGDGDGRIEHYNDNATAATAEGRMEGNIAWQQLLNDTPSFIDGGFTPATADTSAGVWTTNLTPGTNIPESKYNNAGWVFDYEASFNASAGDNVVIITAAMPADIGTASSSAVEATSVAILGGGDALSIDTKLDDGDPDTGDVGGHNSTDSNCISSGSYNTTGNTAVCALSFRISPNS